MIRVGVEEAVDDSLLAGFTGDIQLIRIPIDPAPDETFDVDLWIPSHRIATTKRQWTHLKGVKVVQSLLAGVDAIHGFVPPGAILCDARGVLDSPTAEMAVTLVLAAQKYLPFYVELQRHADWRGRKDAEQISLLTPGGSPDPNMPALIDEVEGKTILILGYGSIGKAIEDRLAPFGAHFIRVARSAREGVEPVSNLDALLPQADILIIITPLTSETQHLINAHRLALMKPGALLVNVGRGPIVDTAALLLALEEYKIRAAIDVTDPRAVATRAPTLESAQHSDHAAHLHQQLEVPLPRLRLRRPAGPTLRSRRAAAQHRHRRILDLQRPLRTNRHPAPRAQHRQRRRNRKRALPPEPLRHPRRQRCRHRSAQLRADIHQARKYPRTPSRNIHRRRPERTLRQVQHARSTCKNQPRQLRAMHLRTHHHERRRQQQRSRRQPASPDPQPIRPRQPVTQHASA